MDILKAFKKKRGIEIKQNVSLAPFNTIGTGGRAAMFIDICAQEGVQSESTAQSIAQSEKIILQIKQFCTENNIPLQIIGSGSNLLIAEGEIQTLFLKFSGCRCRPERDGEIFSFSAATPLTSLISWCRQHRLSQYLWAAGIPGTLGGAAVMNAGTLLGEAAQAIEEIRLVTSAVEVRKRSELRFSYRNLDVDKGALFTGIKLHLPPCSEEEFADGEKKIKEFLARRKKTQPAGKTFGSVFKNPPTGPSAGKLLEEAGQKGKRLGGFSFSTLHANFLINSGGNSNDAYSLICSAAEAVEKQFGILLEPEVKMIGFG